MIGSNLSNQLLCYRFNLYDVPYVSEWILYLFSLSNEQDHLVSEESKACLDASLHVDLDSHEDVEDTNDLVGQSMFGYFFTMGDID